MTTESAGPNLLALSDEDFLSQMASGAFEPKEEAAQETSTPDPVQAETQTAAAEEPVVETQSEENNEEVAAQPEQKDSKTEESSGNVPVNNADNKGTDAAAVTTDPSKATAKEKTGDQKPGDAATTAKPEATADSQTAPVDYEKEYKRLLAPFKANGKTIEPRNIDEAIQLMQMGANYTRKMQDIQPHRKTLLMLEKAGLTDPDRLSFLIDLDQGNPQAIQKLLKDRNIDPLSVDTSEDSSYLGGNHKVSDSEVNFRTVLDDVASTQEGKETLQVVNSTWDQASKDVLWNEPQVMKVIHDHRAAGFYDQIAGEVEHQMRLGNISAGTPFIQAYKQVGDMLQASGKLIPSSGSAAAATTAQPAPVVNTPVATRVATPKPPVTNGDQASAAAATRSTPRKVEKAVNYLAMSDDEFLKQMANRV